MTNWTEDFGVGTQLSDVSIALNKFLGKVKHQRHFKLVTATRPLNGTI